MNWLREHGLHGIQQLNKLYCSYCTRYFYIIIRSVSYCLLYLLFCCRRPKNILFSFNLISNTYLIEKTRILSCSSDGLHFYAYGNRVSSCWPVWLFVCLSVCLSRQKTLNLFNNFWTVKGKALIFHMCIPCDITFPSVPNLLTSWPWPWPLTDILKTLILLITF